MNSVVRDSQNGFVDVLGGEVEIERISHLEIEMNRKDLLPVFEYFHQVKPDWNNRYKNLLAISWPTRSHNTKN